MHCCTWLKNVLSNMNGKGMSVVPRERYGRSFFAFRCRSVDQALWSKIALQSAIDVAHAQAAEVAINHCPGCGTPLEQLIDANPEEFAQLCRQVED